MKILTCTIDNQQSYFHVLEISINLGIQREFKINNNKIH